MSTILVVGATGMLGREICRQLTAAGRNVRGLVRESSDPGRVSELQALGVETVSGDVRDRSSLERACEGVEAVISTVSAMPFSYQPGVNDIQTVDLEGVTSLIEAAKAKDVSHFIHTSISGNINTDFPLNNAKREVERRLRESGLVYTILRASFFMEAWLSPAVGFDPANAKAAIYGTGQNPLSWIAVQDVARFAVASLDHPAAKNATLELGGPEAISPLHAVKLFEQANGRPFELSFVPEEALEAQQAAATDPMQKSFIALMRFVAAGDPIEMTDTLRTFSIKPMSVEEYARQRVSAA
ncbi:MAG TPA: SDR family oxidoreductase [Anaerolineales bacterium]